jgi:hypothetical protein
MNDNLLKQTLGLKIIAEKVARRIQTNVPAYQHFLENRGVKIGESFANLPPTDKKSYILAYPYEQLLGDDSKQILAIFRSSGSSGNPFFWPYLKSSNRFAALGTRIFLEKSFAIHQKKTIAIVGLGLGSCGYGLSPLVEKVSYGGKTIPYLQFLIPGLMGVSTLFQAFFEASYGSFIRLQLQKTWQGLLTAPLNFTEVFLGDWLWAATKGTIAGTSMGLFAVLFGFYPSWQLLISLPIIFLGSLLFAAAGLFTAGTVLYQYFFVSRRGAEAQRRERKERLLQEVYCLEHCIWWQFLFHILRLLLGKMA